MNLTTLRRFLAAIDQGFCRLQRIRYDAPWNEGRRRQAC
jgi:hypothetical protein